MKKLAWLLLAALLLSGCGRQSETPPPMTGPAVTGETEESVEATTAPTLPPDQHLVFTFAGDCTLGCHTAHNRAGYGFRLTVGEDYDYPFRNVREWFENDDFTMVNLEGVLGDRGSPAGRKYAFRGPASYVNILTQNSVELFVRPTKLKQKNFLLFLLVCTKKTQLG